MERAERRLRDVSVRLKCRWRLTQLLYFSCLSLVTLYTQRPLHTFPCRLGNCQLVTELLRTFYVMDFGLNTSTFLRHLSLSLSVCVCVCVSVCLSAFLLLLTCYADVSKSERPNFEPCRIHNKTAELSQRRRRDAPNIWVSRKISRVLTSPRLLFPNFVMGVYSDRY